jgi:RsiW-degrading membrane proteinase PrsW (M82 family)
VPEHLDHPMQSEGNERAQRSPRVIPTDPDPVRERIARERAGESMGDAVDRSVYDEPSFNAGRPAAAHGLTFASWYADRLAATGFVRSWVVVLLLAVAAGPTAVVAVFLSGVGTGLGDFSEWVTLTVVGPVAEEVLKVVCVTVALERAPWLFRSRAQFLAVGLAAGLAFAAIENLLYLFVYIPDPSPLIVAWRWTVCVVLHTGCSAIAAMGLAHTWRAARAQLQRPNIESAFPFLLAAIIIHGLYNAAAIAMSLAGVF